MLMKVTADQRPVCDGQIVAFITGLKSINTTPKYLRVGKVVDAKDYAIEDLETGKVWKVYPSNIITTGDEGLIKGVEAKIHIRDVF